MQYVRAGRSLRPPTFAACCTYVRHVLLPPCVAVHLCCCADLCLLCLL